MKLKQLLILLALIALLASGLLFVLSHTANAAGYDCKLVGKPGKIRSVSTPWDKENNGKIKLKWSDSYRAHQVEIKYRRSGGSWKTIRTNDDKWHHFNKLKNGQSYSFKVRGVSECGHSSWSKKVSEKP